MESVRRCISHDRIGKVKHSYAIGQAPLKPWVAVRKNGPVICGLCTCMAGLDETCSHVAAILYWLETAVRISEDTTCTSKPNTWLCPTMPRACQQVPFVTMEELEKIASQRKQNLSTSGQEWKLLYTPIEQELDEFYDDLSRVADRKPAMLSLIPQYSEIYAQSSLPPSNSLALSL